MIRHHEHGSLPQQHEHDFAASRSEIHRNLPTAILIEEALRRGEGELTATGPLVVQTRPHTGRSPDDKFIVSDPEIDSDIWWGTVNQPLSPEHFRLLKESVLDHLQGRELFIQDLVAGSDPNYRLRVRLITETAWHALFARNLFILPGADTADDSSTTAPDLTILHAPSFHTDPAIHGTHSSTAIVLAFADHHVVIAGTAYAGEIKKSVFSALQFILPRQDITTMHCSANMANDGRNVALFFGLSGTGKTTLSTSSDRTLVGDDEHGWSDQGVFNFEGGSYAKTIRLSAEAEPDIYRATHEFGTVLENVVVDPITRELDLDDDSITENTRAAFPLELLGNASTEGIASHPSHIVFLTADAFGVLPPVARLTTEQALYYFLSGYTSKLAGTERGVTHPETTFSTCFGAPFLPLPPTIYAELLGERLRRHEPSMWLVNTGWSGGPVGVGERMPIAVTRAIVRAIVDGTLASVPTVTDPFFGLAIPESCSEVPSRILQPRQTWADADAYDAAADDLIAQFQENFRQFEGSVPSALAAAGPGEARA